MKSLSQTGEALIETFEGLSLVSYQDQRGIWTIAYGHTGPNVVKGSTCTMPQAEQWLMEDTQHAANGVNTAVPSCSQNEFDAMVSLAYNIGVGAFSGSTLVKLMNAGDIEGAAQEFLKWDKTGGVLNAGLQRRRLAEQALFLRA